MVSLVLNLGITFVFLCQYPLNASIADVTRDRYGSTTLAIFRELENARTKSSKVKQDLDFLLKCQNADLFPVFLRFKLSSKQLSRSSDIARFRRRLLQREINNKRKTLQRLLERTSVLSANLKSVVRHVDFVHYQRVISDTCSKASSKVSAIHQNKLSRLRAQALVDNALLNPDSVISNLSSYQLSDIEKAALARGLKFTLPPGRLKKGSYLANFELLFKKLNLESFSGTSEDKLYFQNKLRDCAFSSMYNFNSSRHTLNNMPPEELQALQNLAKNKDIVVMRPDKGTGVVIMDKSDYVTKVEQIILDETKFKVHKNQDLYKVSRSIERKVRDFLREKVSKPGHITKEQYNKLYPNGSHIGVLYGQPKVHKQNAPMRPICSAVGTSTYELSKFVAEIISPAASNVHGTDLKDTFQFVQQISDININNYYMVSFDVQSLFTNVPLDETIKICLDRLYRSSNPDIVPPTLPENVLKGMIEICLKDNTFVFNQKVYYQVDGVAMGNPLGPLFANIFMAHLEETYIHGSQYSPDYYWRYVDDTFCLFSNREDVVKFHEFLDSLHPSAKFDREEESDGKLSFLDTVIKRTEDPNPNISTRIKPTDKGLLYNYSSFVPDKTKTALISTLVYRAYRIASDMLTFHLDITVLKNKLTSNGFPTHLIDTYIGAVLGRHHANISQPSTTDVPRKEVLVVMPYLGPVSHLVKRQLTKLVHKFYPSVELKFVYRRGFRIANMFNYKDKFPLSCKSMVVYYTQCKQCGPSAAYIGKTVNTVYERFFASGTGHLAPNNKNSALLDHLVSTGDPNCDFVFNDLKILDTGSYDEQIRFIESILLKYDKQNLNTCERSIELQLV